MTQQSLEEKLKYPTGKIRVVIDSDAFNEVDDQFAIAWALKEVDRLDVEAVYAAPFSHGCMGDRIKTDNQLIKGVLSHMVNHASGPEDGMLQSYEEILKLFKLMKIDPTGKVFRGSPDYLKDLSTPVVSESATDLVQRAMNGKGHLYVIAIGAITNIASAILIEPKIADNMTVIWLGGQPLHFPQTIEFNLMQDINAVNVVLNSKVPLVLIPCMSVASSLTVSSADLREKLLGKSNVGSYLSEIVTSKLDNDDGAGFADLLFRNAYLKDLDDTEEEVLNQFKTTELAWSRVIWDISAVAYLINPAWCYTTLTTSPNVTEELTWQRDEKRHPIRICNYVNRDAVLGRMFKMLKD